MGQAQPLAGWCWVFSVVHAQMGPCSYIELQVWRCRTNRRTHHSDIPRTSGTYRNTWTDGFGCRHTEAEYHHCQHLKMWIPPKRRTTAQSNFQTHFRTTYCFSLSSVNVCCISFFWLSRTFSAASSYKNKIFVLLASTQQRIF